MFIVKVPGINGLGKTKGCERSGNAMLKILKEEIYSSEAGKSIEYGKLDLEEIHLDNENLNLTNKLIYENSLETYETKPKSIFLGGDHSISFSLTKAFLDYCKKENKEPCLIVFDSRPNCEDVLNKSFPINLSWIRGLVEAGFPAENILLVGIRNFLKEEMDFIKEKKIKKLSINEILLDIENACDTIMEFANGKELYVSLDIGVADSVFAPATGYPEVGGLTSRQLIYLVQRINKIKNLKAIDLVEINCEKDKKFDNLTTKLGAKILGELI